MNEPFYLNLETCASSCTVEEALEGLINISKRMMLSVKTTINGKMVLAHPNTDWAALVDAWKKASESNYDIVSA